MIFFQKIFGILSRASPCVRSRCLSTFSQRRFGNLRFHSSRASPCVYSRCLSAFSQRRFGNLRFHSSRASPYIRSHLCTKMMQASFSTQMFTHALLIVFVYIISYSAGKKRGIKNKTAEAKLQPPFVISIHLSYFQNPFFFLSFVSEPPFLPASTFFAAFRLSPVTSSNFLSRSFASWESLSGTCTTSVT